MVTTYFLREKVALQTGNSQILRIIDRDTILTGTLFGCVYITRPEAARILRNYRRSVQNPTMYNGEQIAFYEYEKNVTP